MRTALIAVVAAAVTFAPATVSAKEKNDAAERLDAAAELMTEMMHASDKGVPQDLLNRSRCVILVPGLKKAAFIIGGKYGRGFASCRKANGVGWSAPAPIRIEGGSVGFQIGGEATDFVFLVMNDRGANSLLHSKVRLGADASAAAGPVGRLASADTDAYMRSEILSYSRARGAFAGISLEGSTLRPDSGANRNLYRRSIGAAEIINGSEVQTPAAAGDLIAVLRKASPQLKS